MGAYSHALKFAVPYFVEVPKMHPRTLSQHPRRPAHSAERLEATLSTKGWDTDIVTAEKKGVELLHTAPALSILATPVTPAPVIHITGSGFAMLMLRRADKRHARYPFARMNFGKPSCTRSTSCGVPIISKRYNTGTWSFCETISAAKQYAP